MSPSGNLDWVWYGAGVVLALFGLALTYWSLLHDRARGRRRCPKCWYDMSSPGPDPLTCPECGRTAKSEKKLFKTRRRWRWACLSILILLPASVSSFAWPTVYDWDTRDWVDHLPMTVLVALFQFCDGDADSSSLEAEIYNRTSYWMGGIDKSYSRMADWQWHWAMRHCLNVLEDHSESVLVYESAAFEEWHVRREYISSMKQPFFSQVSFGLRQRLGQGTDLVERIVDIFPLTVMPLSPPRQIWVSNSAKNGYLYPLNYFQVTSRPPISGFDSIRTSARLISPPPEQAELWMLKEFDIDAAPINKWRMPKPGHYEFEVEVEIEVLVVRERYPDETREWVHADTQRVKFNMIWVDDFALAYSPRQGDEIDRVIIDGLHIIDGFGAPPGDHKIIRFGLGAANNTFWHESLPPGINFELLWNGQTFGMGNPWNGMHPQDDLQVGEFYFDLKLIRPGTSLAEMRSETYQPPNYLIDELLAAPEQWTLHFWCDPGEDEQEVQGWFYETARLHYWIGDIRIPLSNLDLSPLKP